jgi:NADPH-dependent glutamate synthase beta subunit-like oxidoreductase
VTRFDARDRKVSGEARYTLAVADASEGASSAHMTPRFQNGHHRSDGPVLVLGGGPAGLTAGYLLAKRASPSPSWRRPTRSAAWP